MKLLKVKVKIAPTGYDNRSVCIVLDEESAKRVASWLEELVDFIYDVVEAGWNRDEIKVTLEE